MKAIGVNTIRVYTVDADADHDGCMQAFASQGIYVWVDLPTPTDSINRANPKYTMALFDHYSSVIDSFAKYNNTLSFTAGNEVMNDPETTSAAPFVKAIVRDLKGFRDARGYRKIPISYTSGDVPKLQLPAKSYLACGDQATTIEMYGMNVYSWCGNSTYQVSGYDDVYTQFQDINIPVIFSEVGCKQRGARTFEEVATILGSVFPATFSGVIVYEWLQDTNEYGLVEYPNSDGTGFPSTLADYSNLASVYTTASPVSTALDLYTPSNTPPACPTSNSKWPLSGAEALPTVQALNIDEVTARTTYYSSSATLPTASATGTSNAESGVSAPVQEQAQQSLSTAVIAGIAVACTAFGSALAVGLFFLLRKRRADNRRRRGNGAPWSGSSEDQAQGFTDKPELPGGTHNPFIAKQELETQYVYEADAAENAQEMSAPEVQLAHEMPGSRPRANELEGSPAAQEVK